MLEEHARARLPELVVVEYAGGDVRGMLDLVCQKMNAAADASSMSENDRSRRCWSCYAKGCLPEDILEISQP